MSDERPAPPDAGPANSVLDMLQSGRMSKDPTARIDPIIYDPSTGKPIPMGNTDPNVIGPDDSPEVFAYRGPGAYLEVPEPVKTAETRFVLPMAQFIANTLGITVLDETAYEKVLTALRCRALFVVLNIHKTKIEDGTASWFGLLLLCKRHVVTMVRFKLRIGTGQIGIDQVRLWDRSTSQYGVHSGPEGRFFTREEASALILNYLRNEGIVANL